MATTFPATLDALTNPAATSNTVAISHAGQHTNANDAIEALEAKVGADSSAVTTSLDYKVTQLESAPPAHTHLLAAGATDVTASAAEVNLLDGVTTSTAEINILDGVTASAAELNILDGITASTTELNYTDGVTSAIQTQLNAKAPLDSPVFTTAVTLPDTELSGNIDFTTHSFSNCWNGTFMGQVTTPNVTITEGTTSANGITFGTDANIYRPYADAIKTDDSLVVGGGSINNNQNINIYQTTGKLTFSGASAGSYDTNLYASAANVLKTDDAMTVALDLTVHPSSDTGAVNIGNFATIESKINPDDEEAAIITSTQSFDANLGAAGWFNVRNHYGEYIFGVEEETGNISANGILEPRDSAISSATPTPDTDTTDLCLITASSAIAIANPIGIHIEGQKLILRIKDDGTPRAITFGTKYRFSSDLAAPTTTVTSKVLYVGLMYNYIDDKWDCLAILNNF